MVTAAAAIAAWKEAGNASLGRANAKY